MGIQSQFVVIALSMGVGYVGVELCAAMCNNAKGVCFRVNVFYGNVRWVNLSYEYISSYGFHIGAAPIEIYHGEHEEHEEKTILLNYALRDVRDLRGEYIFSLCRLG